MIKHSTEWNELLGDAIEDTQEHQAILEAVADKQELTEADLDDWYASLMGEVEQYEDHKDRL